MGCKTSRGPLDAVQFRCQVATVHLAGLAVLGLLFFGPTEGRCELVCIWERVLFRRRQGVICICRHGHWRARAAERVPDCVIVAITADEYADCGCVTLSAEQIVHE